MAFVAVYLRWIFNWFLGNFAIIPFYIIWFNCAFTADAYFSASPEPSFAGPNGADPWPQTPILFISTFYSGIYFSAFPLPPDQPNAEHAERCHCCCAQNWSCRCRMQRNEVGELALQFGRQSSSLKRRNSQGSPPWAAAAPLLVDTVAAAAVVGHTVAFTKFWVELFRDSEGYKSGWIHNT